MATAYLNLEGIGKVEASCCYFDPYCVGWQHLLNGMVLHDLIGDLLCGRWHWIAQLAHNQSPHDERLRVRDLHVNVTQALECSLICRSALQLSVFCQTESGRLARSWASFPAWLGPQKAKLQPEVSPAFTTAVLPGQQPFSTTLCSCRRLWFWHLQTWSYRQDYAHVRCHFLLKT